MDTKTEKLAIDAVIQCEKMRDALALALDLLKKNYMIKMAAAALPAEVEMAWRHYCRTTPEMAQIIAALNS